MTFVTSALVVLILAFCFALAAWLWGERQAQLVRTQASTSEQELRSRLATAEQRVMNLNERLGLENEEREKVLAEWRERHDEATQALRENDDALRATQGNLRACEEKLTSARNSIESERVRAHQLEASLNEQRDLVSSVRERLVQNETYQDATKDKLQFLDEARTTLCEQMKLVANDVLIQSGRQFTAEQQEKLATTLAPFKEALGTFSKKVEDSDRERTKEQGRLGSQLEQLMKASAALDKGAHDLTRALTGDNKISGDWGETVLERVLENAGLHEGREFVTQHTERDTEGNLVRPDVVIQLPERKSLVVDAKVSLKSWVAHSTEPTPGNWANVMFSVRAHLQALAKKNYHELYGLTSVDFVLMFIPTEGAFLELVRQEADFLQDAWNKRIMIVGPSNLQWALRMVAALWRFEHQNDNAQEIAAQAAQMYDKFAGFMEELEKVGTNLNRAVGAYNGARNKLGTGRGHLIGRAEKFRQLGVQPKGRLPEEPVIASYADGVPLLSEPPNESQVVQRSLTCDTEAMLHMGIEQ
jgi:DNA recombination protein RmuC